MGMAATGQEQTLGMNRVSDYMTRVAVTYDPELGRVLTPLSDRLSWMLPRRLMSQKPTAGRCGRRSDGDFFMRDAYGHLDAVLIRLLSEQVVSLQSLGAAHHHRGAGVVTRSARRA
jgi:hypothetical protein